MDSQLQEIHPGEVLREEFMRPLSLSDAELAVGLGIPLLQISAVIEGNAPITMNMASRLAAYFKVSAQFWLNLQTEYDARTAAKSAAR